MSKIGELGPKLETLPLVIGKYEQALEDVEENLRVKGKTLETALKDQATWIIYYSQRRAELKTLLSFLEDRVAAKRGELARRYIENYSRQIGERVMNAYIDAEPEYLRVRELYLEVEDIYQRYDAVVDAFEKRGYALRDLTNAKIHQIHNGDL